MSVQRAGVLDRPEARFRLRPPTVPIRAGVLGAVLVFLGLAILSGLAVQPFRSKDESAHVAYAVDVGHGTIPRTDQPVPGTLPGERDTDIYTANHPPLYYVLTTGPLLFGMGIGHPVLGLHLARVESALFSAGAVALTAALGWTLFAGRRPQVSVAAAGILATTGAFVYTSSLVYNDSLATLLCLAVLLGALTVLRQGLQRRTCLLLALAAAAATATRASNAEIVTVACVALVAAGALHDPDRRAGALRGLRWVAATLAACAAGSGWFFLLNQSRYGHLTGRSTLVNPPRSITGFLFSPRTYGAMIRETYGDLSGVLHVLVWSNTVTTVALAVIWSLGGIGLVWWLRRSPASLPPTTRAVIGLLALHLALCLLYVTWWVHKGGYPHTRYLFPALPVLAVVLALGFRSLPGGRWWTAAVISLQLALSLIYLAKQPGAWAGGRLWSIYPDALSKAGVPAPIVVTGLLLAVVACGWVLCLRAVLAESPAPAGSGD